MSQFRKRPLARAVSAALTGSVIATAIAVPAYADPVLEEIVVTAQKRQENLQDVPLSVQVLGNKELQELNLKSFEDYVQFLPTVSFTYAGPGYGQVYMRGIASGGDGVHSGSMPSVGVYLDEQPVTTINQILDIHVYDIARIETLAGPQGTLYGQGSQAGTLRIITNKPDTKGFEAGYDVSLNTVDGGDPGYGVEGFVNIPLSEKMALRMVGWTEYDGGYIDNVPATINYPWNSANSISGDVSRDNTAAYPGQPVAKVEDNFNDATTTGGRALLKIDLNDNWSVTPGIMAQVQETNGTWAHDPQDVGDLKATRFFEDTTDEDWYQATLTLEGTIGGLDVVYAGSYLDRNLDSTYDYTGYAEYIDSLTQYYHDYYGSGYYCSYYNAAGNDCVDPSQYVAGFEKFTRVSNEFRVQSSQDQRLRWIAGFFSQQQLHDFDLRWNVPAMDPANSVIEGGDTTWQTYQIRKDRDLALFGEITYDFTEKLSATFGMRFFDYENSLYGFNGFQGHCTGYYDDNGDFVEDRENGEVQYPCFDTRILDDVAKGDGNTMKLNVNYTIDDSKMVYVTYSEGFRAGGVNRARVEGIPKYKPDWVYNYEAGWKTTWMDGRLRFNGAVYYLNWEDFQYGFLDFTVSNLTIIGNVGQAETIGTEFDLTYAATDDLTLSLAGSYNKAELKDPYYRNSDEEATGIPRSPAGTPMPYVPEWQFTGVGRYHFEMASIPSYAQLAFAYTGERWNELDTTNDVRTLMDAYTIVNGAVGINKDSWSLELFGSNLTDERAQIDVLDPGYPSALDTRTYTNRPRTFGIRFSQRF
jgi:outer membrane receptor protein involved in Fe transport